MKKTSTLWILMAFIFFGNVAIHGTSGRYKLAIFFTICAFIELACGIYYKIKENKSEEDDNKEV